ncbi:MAG: hypothetical protein BWK79_19740 [Beggiatoa sp. IS2]|nr:MAG: hypothetical protein BWK79_19740 [Beggiatoa sp. IS2]
MLEEYGIIVKTHEQFAWVQFQRQSSCHHCGTGAGCGTASINNLLGPKYTEVKVPNLLAAQIGDTVIVGLEERALLQGSILLYLLPLLCMLAGAFSYELFVARDLLPASDLLTALTSFGGLSGGIVWASVLLAKFSDTGRYQPVMLRISI